MSQISSPSSSQHCEVVDRTSSAQEEVVEVTDMTGDVATISNRVTPPPFTVPTMKSLDTSHKADIEAMLKPKAMTADSKRTMFYSFVDNNAASLVFSEDNRDDEMMNMFRLKEDGKTARSKKDLTLVGREVPMGKRPEVPLKKLPDKRKWPSES
jgi:hypothetical protein